MNASSRARPLPQPSELTAGFWEACRRGQLVVQRCGDCGLLRHYPQWLCPVCRSSRWSWSPVSGRGEIYSYSICHRAFHPAWADRVPYVVATIELEEGVRLVCDLPDLAPEQVRIGLPVEVGFEEHSPEISLPRFRVREA